MKKDPFKKLPTEHTPPPGLEEEVINALLDENLIQSPTIMTMNLWKWAASAAAAVLIFFAGNYVGSSGGINPENGYMLILHEDDSFRPGEPMEMFEEYSSWMESTFAKGVQVDGQELDPMAVLISGDQTTNLSPQASQRTTGYFVVEAQSLQDAVAIAQENPHIKYGGSIEVKPFMNR